MTIPKINSAHGSDTRNIINRAIDLINVQGKSIQDIVAEGQLTPAQYATLIQTVNGLISKGDVAFSDIDINKGKLLPKHLSEEVLKMLTGDAPINAVPADGSITKRKMADKAIDRSILSPYFMNGGRILNDVSIDTVMEDGNYIITAGNPGTFPAGESPDQNWCMTVVTTENWGKQTLYKLQNPEIMYHRAIIKTALVVEEWKTDKEEKSFSLYNRRIEPDESIDTVVEDGNYIMTAGNIGTLPEGVTNSSLYLKVEVINDAWVQQYLGGILNEKIMYKRSFQRTNPTPEQLSRWERIVTESYLESRLPIFDGGGGNNSGNESHLKILMVGNSFSLDTTHYLHRISASVGVNMTVGILYRSGEGLDSHLNNATNDLSNYTYHKRVSENGYANQNTTNNTSIKTGILDEDWDVITFQQRSGDSDNYTTYQPYLNDLKDYVAGLATNSNVKYGVLQTWAYSGSQGREGMYTGIVEAYENAMFDADIGIMIPVGTAIENARSVPRIKSIDNELTNDGFHLGVLGDYIAGLTMFKNFYPNINSKDVNFKPEEVTNYQKYMASIAAENANLKPFKITAYK